MLKAYFKKDFYKIKTKKLQRILRKERLETNERM